MKHSYFDQNGKMTLPDHPQMPTPLPSPEEEKTMNPSFEHLHGREATYGKSPKDKVAFHEDFQAYKDLLEEHEIVCSVHENKTIGESRFAVTIGGLDAGYEDVSSGLIFVLLGGQYDTTQIRQFNRYLSLHKGFGLPSVGQLRKP